jgi:lipid-binding SYLF domain-containing protein
MKITLWRVVLLMGLVCAPSAPAGIFGPSGDDTDEKKANVRKQRDELLTELYSSQPELKTKIQKAVGYATFKNLNLNLLLLATANGYGMVVDNKTGKETFMRMASLGGGVGAGVRDVRVVFIFHDAKVMSQFVEKGWQFGGEADASAKYKDTGIAAEQSGKANVSVKEGVNAGMSSDAAAGVNKDNKDRASAGTEGAMEIYEFTQSGVSLQATVAGTKFWKDGKLNQ